MTAELRTVTLSRAMLGISTAPAVDHLLLRFAAHISK